MRQRRLIQQVTAQPPVRQQRIHERLEPGVVGAFVQVNQLMHQDVLQAGRRLLGQFQIQPDAPGRDVAAPPAGFHAPDARFGDSDTDAGLPFSQQRRQLGLERLPIPVLQDRRSRFPVGMGGCQPKPDKILSAQI